MVHHGRNRRNETHQFRPKRTTCSIIASGMQRPTTNETALVQALSNLVLPAAAGDVPTSWTPSAEVGVACLRDMPTEGTSSRGFLSFCCSPAEFRHLAVSEPSGQRSEQSEEIKIKNWPTTRLWAGLDLVVLLQTRIAMVAHSRNCTVMQASLKAHRTQIHNQTQMKFVALQSDPER